MIITSCSTMSKYIHTVIVNRLKHPHISILLFFELFETKLHFLFPLQ